MSDFGAAHRIPVAADAVHLVGIPYLWSSLMCLAVVASLFFFWRLGEGTLSIHSVDSRPRELFYWAAVSATFALGTAVVSGLVFIGLIVVPLVGWRWFRLNAVIAFWAANVLTRPLGASFADWLAKPTSRSGLGFDE
jgi:uncharacterized membrane-anchored protein